MENLKNICTGCNACVAICGIGAIKTEIDENGFWYPHIDTTKCIDCGKCKKICPVDNYFINANMTRQIYVAWSLDDEIRKNSSSGGIFSEVALSILDNGGIVVGAALDIESKNVKHIIIDSKDELNLLRGSKYIQSYIDNNIYTSIKEKLCIGKKVLFTGTSCQVAGLKAYLKKTFDNLYTIDLVCHGVPSPFVLERYLDDFKKSSKGEIQDIIFRSKDNGWKRFEMKLKFEKAFYRCWFNKDPFGKSFIYNMFLRESCYDCQFKDGRSQADITLGDFWKISEKYDVDDKGCSLVIVNSQNGEKMISKLDNKIYIDKVSMEDALPGNLTLVQSSKKFELRDEAFFRIKNESFKKVVFSYVQDSLLIRIKNKIRNKLRRK